MDKRNTALGNRRFATSSFATPFNKSGSSNTAVNKGANAAKHGS